MSSDLPDNVRQAAIEAASWSGIFEVGRLGTEVAETAFKAIVPVVAEYYETSQPLKAYRDLNNHLMAQLRDAQAETDRLRKLNDRNARNLAGYGPNMSGYTVAEVEVVEAELAEARATIQKIREWATGNYGGTKRPIDIWPGLAAALRDDQ